MERIVTQVINIHLDFKINPYHSV